MLPAGNFNPFVVVVVVETISSRNGRTSGEINELKARFTRGGTARGIKRRISPTSTTSIRVVAPENA